MSDPKSTIYTIIDNQKTIFKIHKLGYVTCVCNQIIQNHECLLIPGDNQITIKFQVCSESICRFCESSLKWHYERYLEKDDKICCRKCENEIPKENGICHDCFCKECFSFLNECVCCKFCVGTQCICNDDTISVNSN